MLQVIAVCTLEPYIFAIALAPGGGNGYFQFPVEILGRYGMGAQHIRRRSLEHYFPTLAPSLGTYVHDIIGCQHHVFVVLDHDDRVAQVTKFFQGMYQPLIVSLVETYAWLVKDIKHIHQLAAYLRGQPNALALSSRKAGGLPVEGKIVQADLQEEINPGA